MDDDALETILPLIQIMERGILGLQQVSAGLPTSTDKKAIQALIKEGETKLAEIKRRIVQ